MRRVSICGAVAALALAGAAAPSGANENYESWPLLRSSFLSTGGNGVTIKGYDPVIVGGQCITTFMAVEPGPDGAVYPNVIEFTAVAALGGTLCTDGKWRSFDGKASGTTPFRVFFKDGVFRGWPM